MCICIWMSSSEHKDVSRCLRPYSRHTNACHQFLETSRAWSKFSNPLIIFVDTMWHITWGRTLTPLLIGYHVSVCPVWSWVLSASVQSSRYLQGYQSVDSCLIVYRVKDKVPDTLQIGSDLIKLPRMVEKWIAGRVSEWSSMEYWTDYWLCYVKLSGASWKEWNIPVEPPAWGVDK